MRITDVTLMQAVEKIKMPTQYETERFMTIAISKQIPMKVKFKESDNEIYCPSCKEYICENEYFGYPIGEDEHYCRNCGQKLDWGKN